MIVRCNVRNVIILTVPGCKRYVDAGEHGASCHLQIKVLVTVR